MGKNFNQRTKLKEISDNSKVDGKRRVIFLDRDGVINKFPGKTKFVTSLRSFKFIPGSLEAIKKLTKAGFNIFIISNQSGISKKLYSRATLRAITNKMLKGIKRRGGRIRRVLYCIHSPGQNCSCRKPKTGLIKVALQSINSRIDRKSSFIIGDDIARDIPLGKRVGLKTILVLSGRDGPNSKMPSRKQPDYIFKNLLQAVNFIVMDSAKNSSNKFLG